ncbi:isochorismatase family protein [Chitiniphilus eburneus]|uniref:Isochorismatase family protein n=1 Tax=Chitiniphilus eburneus TaxID=2571148 RepID=A0A4U0PI91_9NEIS|nr:isochorismatase family protein [Chitiniphilus eburneus]TJZ67440.1 isochorismatase family protein [Chitiniphilus eburneus]
MAIPLIQDYPVPTGVTLHRPPLPWQVAPERAALLIHDMQNYFVARYESDAFVRGLVERIDAIRQRCHALGIPTFYTAQPGDQPRSARGLLVDFWGPGMPQAGDGRAIVPGLEPRLGHDQLLVKHRYSAFERSDLLERLRALGRDQLVICGVYAHIGCLVTATDAFMADIEPFLVADALGDFSQAHHEMALHHVAHCSGKVLSSAELLQQLGDAA